MAKTIRPNDKMITPANVEMIVFKDPGLVGSVLYCTSEEVTGGAEVHQRYGRGIFMGVASTLMALFGIDTEQATKIIGSHLPNDVDIECVPEHARGVLLQTCSFLSHIKERLEYLRGELRSERISYSDLHELQTLAAYIDRNDVELLEAAGVPEFPEDPTI